MGFLEKMLKVRARQLKSGTSLACSNDPGTAYHCDALANRFAEAIRAGGILPVVRKLRNLRRHRERCARIARGSSCGKFVGGWPRK